MFPDRWFFRWPIRLILGDHGLLAMQIYLSVIILVHAFVTGTNFGLFQYIASAELLWYLRDLHARRWLRQHVQPRRTFDGVPENERIPLMRAMLATDENVWEDVFRGFFHKTAPRRGIEDPALTLKVEEVGRDNLRDWVEHYMFGGGEMSTKDEVEIEYLVTMIEVALLPRKPQRGRVADVKCFTLYDKPLSMVHQPLLFYVTTTTLTQLGNFALWVSGFVHNGMKQPFFALYVMRGRNARRIDSNVPKEDREMIKRVGYWYVRGDKQNKLPIVFFHGMSGCYGPTPLLIALARISKRSILVIEYPLVMMRSAPFATLIARRETIAAVRYRHYGRCIVFGHSLGTLPAAWMLKDAPDLVAKTVLLDPATIGFHRPAVTVNFFRTDARTAAEIFFRRFTLEKGIAAFFSRFVIWSEAALFGPKDLHPRQYPPIPEPLRREHFVDVTRLVPEDTLVLSSSDDCICPSASVEQYCKAQDIPFKMMYGFDHARVLFSPHWIKQVCHDVDEIGKQAPEEQRKAQ